MKMMKSVLLGTVAGFVTVGAGQAAELPVKAPAQPVEYVKVCSAYGAGFYYMPGTDMCIKIGGYVRAEVSDPVNGSLSWGPFNGNLNTRQTNNLTVRAKGFITADAREQTDYGIARAYISIGLQTNTIGADNASNTFVSNRAFLQWAGFTVGLARSFYDFYNSTALNYRSGYFPTEDTADAGWYIWGYTLVLGGGWSTSVSAETRRMTQIVDAVGVAGAASLATSGTGTGYGGWNVPDVVGNIRLDQTWGSAQIMAAGHQANGLYYGSVAPNGHPGDAWGWVAGAGFHLNTPVISQGDYLEGEFNYTQGALRYLNHSANTTMTFANGGDQSFGIISDCVYGSAAAVGVLPARFGTRCETTTGWSAALGYEHYWTPQWHQSFSGAFMQVRYDNTANDLLCSFLGPTQGSGAGSAAVARGGCNNNWNYWVTGSRLQWDVTKSFYIGVEALYLQEGTAKSANGLVPAAAGLGAATLCSTGVCRDKDEHTWVFTLRMHKDFLP